MESGTLEAVGIWFYSRATQRYLYLMRRDSKNPMTWGLPGGKALAGESLLAAAQRECHEELGYDQPFEKLYPVERFTAINGKFHYHTFVHVIDREFCPILNDEHLGYAWMDHGVWPRPMHPGLWSTVNIDDVMSKISVLRHQIHMSQ